MTDPIVKEATVNCSAERAFDVFVNRISKWWPLEGHAVSAGSGKLALAVAIEPHVGGAVYETMYDGGRADWGEVLEFEPGRKFAMSWCPATPIEKQTRVDVEFTALAADRCKVTLTHSGWEVWDDIAQTKRDTYNGGWVRVFVECFAEACQKVAA